MRYVFRLLLLYMGFTFANFLDLFSPAKWQILINAPAPSIVIAVTTGYIGWLLHDFWYKRKLDDLNREIEKTKNDYSRMSEMRQIKVEILEDENKRLKEGLSLLNASTSANTNSKRKYLKEELLKLSKEIKEFVIEFDIQIEAISTQHRIKEIKASPLERDRLWDEYNQDKVSFGNRRVAEYLARFSNKAEILRQDALKELVTDEPFGDMLPAQRYTNPTTIDNIKTIANELGRFARELDKET